jgi:hypothetical protein
VRLEGGTGLVGWGETPEDWINKSSEGTPEGLLRQQALGREASLASTPGSVSLIDCPGADASG